MTNLRRFGVVFTLALSAGPLTVCPAQAQEMVTIPVEIAAYPATAWASEYVLKEDKIGTLEKGKLAHSLVLNKDFFTVPELELASIFPLMTVVGGKVVVLRREFGEELHQEPVGPQIRFEAGAGRRRE